MNSLFEATSSKIALSFLVFVVILAACEMFHPATPLAKIIEDAAGVLVR